MVLSSGRDAKLGLYVKIKHEDAISVYGNLSDISVFESERVQRGEIIGSFDTNSGKEFYYDLQESILYNELTILRRCRKEAFIESQISIVFSLVYLWYNDSTILRFHRKEGIIESCAGILFPEECTWYNERTILGRCRKEAFIES